MRNHPARKKTPATRKPRHFGMPFVRDETAGKVKIGDNTNHDYRRMSECEIGRAPFAAGPKWFTWFVHCSGI